MQRIFDFHFHLLFKHQIGVGSTGEELSLGEELKTTGIAGLLNDILGGPFDSQSSPSQVAKSQLWLGVTGLLSVEHAFANRVLHVLGRDLSGMLPLNKEIFSQTKAGETTYYQGLKEQISYYLRNAAALNDTFGIQFLNRAAWKGRQPEDIYDRLTTAETKWLAFSIEGGHNLSDVPIRKGIRSTKPELKLKELQDRTDIDFLSINLCHLSYIPEQNLGGFAQGVNKLSSIAFSSEDFMPKVGIGLTDLGKRVIRQALTHASKPILIDVKHMSLYTRLHYYQYRAKLAVEVPRVEQLPIISSHTGFTFTTVADFLNRNKFRSTTYAEGGVPVSVVEPENRKIGRTNDLVNRGLYSNPWTINLFDEEIIEIFQSKGMIGISMDQRILGASNPGVDSLRDKYYEGEHVAYAEWEKLFRDGQLPGAEESLEAERSITPTKPERHIMLLCLHLVHAVRVGQASLAWVEGTSPWDHLCIGSDFDGLINPINGIDNVMQLDLLREELITYLPEADRYLAFHQDIKALRYNQNGTVQSEFLIQVVEAFLFRNGARFIARFLSNWK